MKVREGAEQEAAPSSASRRLSLARGILVALGAVGTIAGAYLLLAENRPKSLLGLAFWLGGALVLHDGVLSGSAWAANRLLRGVGTRLPLSAIATVQVGIVTTFLISLIALPEYLAKEKGPQITTLPQAVGANWVFTAAALLTLTLIASLCTILRARRRAAGRDTSPEA